MTSRLFLYLSLFFLSVPPHLAATHPRSSCAILTALTEDGAYVADWWEWVQRADRTPPGQPPERRIKLINLFDRQPGQKGVLESADLSRPQWLTMPDGQRRPYIFASGTYAFTPRDGDLNNLLRGGPKGRSRVPIQFRFADGRRMKGPYHSGSLPWDFFVTEWPLDMFEKNNPLRVKAEAAGRKYVHVGYGGTMVQPYRLKGASPDAGNWPKQVPGFNQNASRDRHAFEVEFRDGKILATDLGSVFGNEPSVALEWLSKDHEHGYGGRPILNRDGSPWRDPYGKAWFNFERIVGEEIIYADGRVVKQHKEHGKLTITDSEGHVLDKLPEGKILRRIPKRTEIFARRMKSATEAYRPGELLPDGKPAFEEVKLMGVGPEGEKPYPASSRGGNDGDLVEGGNHNWLDPQDFEIAGGTPPSDGFHLLTGSPGNFVDANTVDGKGYGAIVGFRKQSDGPIGPYQPLLQLEPGTPDFKNFTTHLGLKYGIIWGPARPDVFRDTAGKWWMAAHGVPLHTLPPELRKGGWPANPQDFEKYARAGFLFPIRWTVKDGGPWVEVEDPPVPQSYRRRSSSPSNP